MLTIAQIIHLAQDAEAMTTLNMINDRMEELRGSTDKAEIRDLKSQSVAMAQSVQDRINFLGLREFGH